MRILMCLGNPFPPDIRIEKEARALARAGHEVYVLSPFIEERPVEEDMGYAMVLRHIPEQPLVKKAWVFAHMAFRGVDPLWQRKIAEAVEEKRIEAIHVHDLPMVNTGHKIARSRNIPLVADLHENYPELAGIYRGNWRSKIAGIILSEKRWKSFQREWLRHVDRVITVIDEIGGRLVSEYGVPEEKITIVMNTEDIDYFLSIPVQEDVVNRYRPFFTISYIGGFSAHRGIQTAISAMPGILKVIPEARLLLVGAGAVENEVRELAQKLGVDGAVEFTGWQPFELVPSFIAASHVCLVPYIKSVQTNNSGPHKLFQYMAMGKPLIVSSMASLSRIMEETGAGLVYPAEDAGALAEAVIRLYKDKDLATRLGQAGINAVKTKYNWEIEGRKLVELYRNLKVQ